MFGKKFVVASVYRDEDGELHISMGIFKAHHPNYAVDAALAKDRQDFETDPECDYQLIDTEVIQV